MIGSVQSRRSLIPLAVLAASCADRVPPPETVTTYTAQPDLAIGAMEGDGEDVFGRVSGLAVDGLGRIFVSDAQSHEIRVFDQHGTFQFRIAQKGGGPGELDGPCCLAFDPAGRLWVRDVNNARYNRYRVASEAAEYEGMIRMNHAAAGFWNPTTFDSSGNLIDVGMATGAAGPEVVRYRVDSSGTVLGSIQIRQPPADSVGEAMLPVEFPGGRTGFRYYQQPFGPQHRVAHAPTGEWAKVLTGVYAVEWFGSDNEPLRVVRRDLEPVPVTPAERDSVETRLVDELRRFGKRMSDLPWGIPDAKPPVRGIFFDEQGRLWVERSVAEGRPSKADVFERSGALAFSVEWPRNVSLLTAAIGQNAIVGVQVDELGVHHVVRLVFS